MEGLTSAALVHIITNDMAKKTTKERITPDTFMLRKRNYPELWARLAAYHMIASKKNTFSKTLAGLLEVGLAACERPGRGFKSGVGMAP